MTRVLFAAPHRCGAIRRHGLSYSEGEVIEGTAAVAAPVFAADGRVIAAIAITGVIQRFRGARRKLLDRLVSAAGVNISLHLGWQGSLR